MKKKGREGSRGRREVLLEKNARHTHSETQRGKAGESRPDAGTEKSRKKDSKKKE